MSPEAKPRIRKRMIGVVNAIQTKESSRSRSPISIGKSRNWFVAWFMATIFCIIATPFGSSRFAWPELIIYWSCWNLFSVILMYTIVALALRLGVRRFFVLSLVSSTIFASIYVPVWIFIMQRNSAPQASLILEIWRNCFLVAMTIFTIIQLARLNTTPASQRPDLDRRLTQYPNAQILALSAQDHYVEVLTSQGTELVRMNFRDAMREMRGVEGYQIHRSVWVARCAIRKFVRAKGEVELTSGGVVRVSHRRLREFQNYLKQSSAPKDGNALEERLVIRAPKS